MEENDNEIHLTKLKPSLYYTYGLLKTTYKKDMMDHVNKKTYSFDLSKVDQIFKIKLSNGYRILSKKDNKYWKYYNMCDNNTNNYVHFKEMTKKSY